VGNKDLLKKILMKKKSEPGSGQIPTDPKDEFGNNTEERILPRDYPGLETNKRNPLNREEKHKREIQSLLLIDAILEQTAQFTKKDKIVDFAKVKLQLFKFPQISSNIANLHLSPKESKSMWKRLKDKIKNNSMKSISFS
jgi:hypothetical protein